MTDLPISSLPEQAFCIGQRVRPKGALDIVASAFVITAIRQGDVIYHGSEDILLYGRDMWNCTWQAGQLVLAPERPPYVPSERRVIKRAFNGGAAGWSGWVIDGSSRCETDAEMQSRHAVERAAYDRAIR